MPFSAYFFDLDGTLVNTLPLWREAMTLSFAELGCVVTPEIYQKAVEGSWEWHHWCTEFGREMDQEAFRVIKDAHLSRLIAQGVEARPGVELLLVDLLKQGAVIGLVTHSRAWFAEQIIAQLDWQSVFMTQVTRDQIQHAKPHPEGYLLAAERLQVDPVDCLVFEDSPSGLQAAKAAGMSCIVAPDPFLNIPEARFAEADMIVSDLRQIDPSIIEALA